MDEDSRHPEACGGNIEVFFYFLNILRTVTS